jgi:hypothetical protein
MKTKKPCKPDTTGRLGESNYCAKFRSPGSYIVTSPEIAGTMMEELKLYQDHYCLLRLCRPSCLSASMSRQRATVQGSAYLVKRQLLLNRFDGISSASINVSLDQLQLVL